MVLSDEMEEVVVAPFTVLATVGTTEFDAMLDVVDSKDFVDALRFALDDPSRPIQLVLQRGRGTHKPPPCPADELGAAVEVDCFDFSSDLGAHLRRADLVVSHAGAGTVLEALRLQRRLMVVVNDTLMHNHQAEMAEALQEQGYLLCCCGAPALLQAVRERLPDAKLCVFPEEGGGAARLGAMLCRDLWGE